MQKFRGRFFLCKSALNPRGDARSIKCGTSITLEVYVGSDLISLISHSRSNRLMPLRETMHSARRATARPANQFPWGYHGVGHNSRSGYILSVELRTCGPYNMSMHVSSVGCLASLMFMDLPRRPARPSL